MSESEQFKPNGHSPAGVLPGARSGGPEVVRIVTAGRTMMGVPAPKQGTARHAAESTGRAGPRANPGSPEAIDAEFESEGEFIQYSNATSNGADYTAPDATDPNAGRSGGHESPTESITTTDPPPENHSYGLAVIEPLYTSPPMPPWMHITEAEETRDPAPEIVMLTAPNSLAAQQFRSMRYRLEREAHAQIIAVVSPRGGEGKSVTAANLALALAEGGRVKVLLIDAALRSPVQSKLFGIANHNGLSTALNGRDLDPRTGIDVTRVSHSLFVLTAGPKVLSPHAVLGSEAAAHLLGALRQTFRYIVVDSSPVFGNAETLAWHGMIDGYVMIARAGRTTTDDLGKAADRLNRDKILGVSFIGAPSASIPM